uniref:Anaphylatoxin-like domain-containing protein n=1 Tax=Chelonoidis abingdonii TaxID=106734 RepID=A0A8C0HFW7_CHEAB
SHPTSDYQRDGVWLSLLYHLISSLTRCTLITPGVLRVESEEMVIVEAHGHHSPIEARITVYDFPQKKRVLVSTTVSLNPGNGMMNSAKIKLLPKDAQKKEYVYIEAKSSLFILEKVVLLSFHSGYIFIQTDKTIYTPGSTGQFLAGAFLLPLCQHLHIWNPDGIIVEKNMVSSMDQGGIVSRSYKIPDIVNSGVWKIVSKYEHAPQEAFTAEFEVKEYVFSLPATVCFPHRFLYGKPVQGQAYALFGVMVDNEKRSIVNSLNKVLVRTPSPAITTRPNFFFFVFFNPQGSDMVEAEKSGIRIVTSPYKILFSRSATYFKPGLPFNLVVSVVNADGSPAPQVPVRSGTGTSGLTQADGTVQLAINTPADASLLSVKVHVGSLGSSAVWAMVAYGSQGGSRNYLHISVPATQLQPGNALPVSFSLRNSNADVQRQIHYFTYLILNKGKIVRAGRQARQAGQTLVTMFLPITPDLIPSFRIVAYYQVGQKEIVADSVWLDVQDSCMGTVDPHQQDNDVQVPGGKMNLQVKGDPGARVGLVAVDKAVYVLNRKYKFSQAKIWDTVEKSDIGCTPGSGKDHVGVFADAGLLLQTNVGIETPQRAGDPSRCSQPTRLRRSPLMSKRKAAKARQYPSQRLRKCCQDGMQENPMGYSCDRRAKYVLEGGECVQAFLDCCKHIFDCCEHTFKRPPVPRSVPPGGGVFSLQPEGSPNLINSTPVSSRLASRTVLVYLEDSITTWEVQAVSLSGTKGICVANPYEITVMKQFFIDLRLPYSVVRNEQVAIRAVLYNYAPRALQIRVELMYNEKICSSSRRDSRFQQELMIQAGASRAVSYVIIPLELEEVEIEVRAAVHGLPIADGVKKKLRVVPEGMKIFKNIMSILLDPAARGSGRTCWGVTSCGTDSYPLRPARPGDIVGDTVENSIDGANLKHLIQVPAGCGEQNMIGMTPAVIATHYLDSSRQWERLGVDRRAEAIKFITRGEFLSGYGEELGRAQSDSAGAPAAWALTLWSRDCLWLWVFALAYELIAIDPEVLCGAVKWLILYQQKPDGAFQEDAPVIHGEMVVSCSPWGQLDLGLVSLCSIMEQQLGSSGSGFQVWSLGRSITKAGDYLTRSVKDLKKPYSVAITSYALALLGHAEAGERLMAFSTGDRAIAPSCLSRLYSIESTSYALLALLKQKKLELTGPIVRWLTEQRYYGGGYGSTQATIMVFQALAQYQMDVSETKDMALDVSINLPGRSRPLLWRINRDNAMVARTERTKLTDGFTISAKGHGKGTLSVRMGPSTRQCQWPTIEGSALLPGGCFPSQIQSASSRFLGAVDSTMTILDVSMPTGFSPDMDDLDRLTNRVDKYISKFELDTDLSERGSLILYLDKVSSKETECLKFKAHQHFEVGLIQPAAVTVYEYYALENRCTKFYHPTQESGLLKVLCEEEACRCMEEKCSLIKKFKHPPADISVRIEAACEAGVDYGKTAIILLSMLIGHRWLFFVFFKGTEQSIQGKTRRFISPVACKATLNLLENRSYLIWGLSSDLWDVKTEMAYLLGSGSWIELWPNPLECQQGHFQALCKGLEVFAQHMVTNGCPS